MTPKAAALYCRISRDAKDKTALGVQRQEKECREWAKAHGWVIAEVYTDNDVSAFSGKRRKGYERMMAAVEAGERDGILSWANDRLHRAPKELESFIDIVNAAGVPVQTLTGGEYDLTTVGGRQNARIVGAVARGESEQKSERAKAKHRQLAEVGKPPGGQRCFGLTKGRTAVVEEEAKWIRQAADDLLDGRSIGSILREWNDSGVRTSGGRRWIRQSFKNMICSDWVVGKRGGVQAQWPAILDEVTWRRVKARFEANQTGVVWSKTLLSGIASCGLCGHHLVSQPKRGQPSYTCIHRPECLSDPGCGKIRVQAKPFEEDVLTRLFASLSPESLDPGPDVRPDDTEALKAVERLEAVAKDLLEMLGAGEMTREEFNTAKARNDRALEAAQAQLAAITTVTVHRQAVADAADLEARWHGLDIEEQRRYISGLFTSITVGAAVKGRNYYWPGRTRVEFAF